MKKYENLQTMVWNKWEESKDFFYSCDKFGGNLGRSGRRNAKPTPRLVKLQSDLTSTYSCLEPACVLTFSTLEEADEHVDTGHHIKLPENECVYDTIRRQWAATATSIKGKSHKIGESQYHSYAAVQEETSHGWALRKQKTTVRISPAVKDYLTRVVNEGTKDGQPKANPADVAEDLKKKFTKPEWLEVQTIKGYFSRLAALQRGQEISEEDTSNEDGAIAREEFLQDLIQETQKQIDLRQPLV